MTEHEAVYPFYIVDIGFGLELKFDGYREEKQWTLLKKGGGRIFDGDFIDVVDYFGDNVVIYPKDVGGMHDHMCPCGRDWLTGGQADARTTKRMIDEYCRDQFIGGDPVGIPIDHLYKWLEDR